MKRTSLSLGRVLHEDDDFVTMEVAKNDEVKFTLQQDESGETVGGDRFLTLLFVRWEGRSLEVWQPWEDGGEV